MSLSLSASVYFSEPVPILGFRGLGFRGLGISGFRVFRGISGFRGLGFRGLKGRRGLKTTQLGAPQNSDFLKLSQLGFRV